MKNTVFKEKIAPVLQIAVAITVIILSALGLTGVIENISYITTPLLSILLMLQAYSNWGKNKGVAIFSICAGVFVLICALVIFISL